MEDRNNDSTFKGHIFIYKIRNDHSWPLYIIPFRIVGDSDTTFKDLNLNATDSQTGKEIRVILVEDTPRDKRVLLKLPSPLFPEERREIKIEYQLLEPSKTLVYSSATKTANFEFYLSSNGTNRLSAYITYASGNKTLDLSMQVKERQSEQWKSIQSVSLKDVESFAVMQLRWK